MFFEAGFNSPGPACQDSPKGMQGKRIWFYGLIKNKRGWPAKQVKFVCFSIN
jgi:hypothetical protein